MAHLEFNFENDEYLKKKFQELVLHNEDDDSDQATELEYRRRREETDVKTPHSDAPMIPLGISTPRTESTVPAGRPKSRDSSQGGRGPSRRSRSDSRSQTRDGTRPKVCETTGIVDLDTIRMVVDSYADAMSRTTHDRYKIPAVSIPKFKVGGDWRCFLSEFKDMVRLADLKPSHQMAYLKQAIPEEAKKMLYQHKVDAVEEALTMLTELYEPVKDSWTALQELQKVNQQPGERLRVLAGRIKNATIPIKLPTKELDELVKSRFKHALADSETRNLLLWEKEDVSLEHMIQKAQLFEDAKQSHSSNKGKRALRTSTTDESAALKKEIDELKQKLADLQKDKAKPKSKPTCWNCGRKGHFSRNCQQEKVGDGYSRRPKNKGRGQSKKEYKSTGTSVDLNE